MKCLVVLTAVIFVITDAQSPCLEFNNASQVTSCLSKVQEKLTMKNLAFLPSMTGVGAWTPSLRVDVTYDTPGVAFKSCCKNYVYSRFNKMVDPLEFNTTDDTLLPVNERAAPTFNMSAKDTGAQGFPANKMYTLLMVDPDVPYASAGTTAKPLAHWLIVNIQNTTPGDTVLSYRGPAPPDQEPHYYYFLLYEQLASINASALNLATYSGNCTASINNRCLFEVINFATDNNLGLQGVNYFMAMNDPYTNYNRIQSGGSEATYCAGVPEYSNPCKTGGASNIGTTLWLTTVLVFLSYILF